MQGCPGAGVAPQGTGMGEAKEDRGMRQASRAGSKAATSRVWGPSRAGTLSSGRWEVEGALITGR